MHDFVNQEIGERHAYTLAIHNPRAALDKGEQPHAHIMFSQRRTDGIERDPKQYFKRYNSKNPERGGAQKESGGKPRAERRAELIALRKRWAEKTNAHLKRYGHNTSVDHRSLKDRGLDRTLEPHFGPKKIHRMTAEDVGAILKRRSAEGKLERTQREAQSSIDLSGNLSDARRERSRRQVEQNAVAGIKDARTRFAAFKTEQNNKAGASLSQAQNIQQTKEQFRQWNTGKASGQKPKKGSKLSLNHELDQ